MKTLIAIVAMVLLSTAAWGEGKYQGPPKDVLIVGGINGPKELTMEWHISNMHPEWVRSGDTVYMWYEHKKPDKFTAPDPTAWKQTDSKYGAEEYRDPKDIPLMLPGSNKYLDPTIRMWVTKEQICKENAEQADSRYRLERNEVTGEYRITMLKDGKWIIMFPCGDDFYRKTANESDWMKCLERVRRSEQADKAWRPIK